MNAFLVDLENKPGAFAAVAEAIAAKGVNITGAAGASCGTGGRAAIMTADPAATRIALQLANCSFTELEATEAHITADKPGTLAKAARRLADAGVNIEAILPIGMTDRDVIVAFVTNNPAKAREALAATAGVR